MVLKTSIFKLTRPGTTRLSVPIKSFLSSKSFWKFSILIKLPWSWSTTSDTSARAATDSIMCFRLFCCTGKPTVKTCLFENTKRGRATSAVSEVHMSSWVVFAQTLQDLFVVNEAVQRPQNEDIEGDVADFLQLKIPAETL